MHLNDWPLASHLRRHERQRRSSGDDDIEGSDHGRFATAGGRATYPGHSSSSVSLSRSLVSISPGVLSGGSMSISNSSIASTAASTALPTAGTSPCYHQHQQPSYGNNDTGLDEHWRTDAGASSTCSSSADELLSTADGARVENVISVEGGFPQFEQLQMPRGGGSSSRHHDGVFPDSRVNYNMNVRNATGHGINGVTFADGALSALTGGGDKLYARQERQRSPPPPQRQQPNHRCDVGSWPPTHVFPDDLEILLEEDAGDEGDESCDSPGVSYTPNINTQQQQQQPPPLKMELPRASSWASSPTAKHYEAGAPQQQLFQPKEQHDVNDVGSPALSGGVVSSPSPEPYHPCSLLPLQQQQHQQLQDVLDWPASPRLGGLQAPPSRALSPMAASSPVVLRTEGDFLQTLKSTGCGGSAAWEHEGSTTTDNGSSDCSEDLDPVPLFPFHPNHHQNNNNGCTFKDSLQSLVEEVTGGGGVSNCFDLADAAAEAAAAASSPTSIVSRASGPKNLVFPAAAAAAAAAKVGTTAAAIVPRGVLEKVSLGKQLLVSPGSSSSVAAATAAAPVSPPTSPPQTQQQQAPKRKQRPAVGSGKSAKKIAGNGPKKQKKQPLQEQKNPSPVQLMIKTAKKVKALGTGTPAAAAAEGRPSKAARTAATSVAKSPPKSGGVRKAAGRGGESSTKRVKVSPSKGSPSTASPAVAAGKGGKDGDRFLDDKARRSREKNRDHSRRSRERKKAQLEGLKQASIDLGPYRMLVEQAHDMISVHSADADAFFALASGAFYRQLGFEPTKMLGASLLDLVEPKDVQAVVQAIMDTLSRGGIKQVQYRMRPPSDGDAIEVETSFRMASRRLLAITRIVGAGVPRSVSPAQVPLQAPAAPSGGGGGGIQPAVAEAQELGLGSSAPRGVC